MNAEFCYTVPHKYSGAEVKQSILDCFPFRDANDLLGSVELESIEVNSASASLQDVLQVGDELRYTLTNYDEPEVCTRWKLLWEGEEIIAVHKPENLPVSRTTRNIYNTLVQLVRRESDWPDAHLLHRLDLETSGIVLLAKNKLLASKWQPNIATLMHRKIYHALVYGIPTWQDNLFECSLNTRTNSDIRCQMHVCDEGEKGKLSKTHFKVLKTWQQYSLIECELHTGRKHQIRAHLAHLGHPIVGDKIYAHQGEFYLKRIDDALMDEDFEQLQTSHHLLCAKQVSLKLEDASDLVDVEDNEYPIAWLNFVKGLAT